MTATGYNDYLGRIVRRITEALSQPLTGSSKKYANDTKFPHIQINSAGLADGIDRYIRTRLFETPLDPFTGENRRVFSVDPVTEHILKVWARQLLEAEETTTTADAEVTHRYLSEVTKLTMSGPFRASRILYNSICPSQSSVLVPHCNSVLIMPLIVTRSLRFGAGGRRASADSPVELPAVRTRARRSSTNAPSRTSPTMPPPTFTCKAGGPQGVGGCWRWEM